MDNSINFKGAFWLQQPTKSVKHSILPRLGKVHQIFDNFTNDGDVLYITGKSADKRIAEILTHSKTKFKYYPQLDLSSGFNNKFSSEAMNILNGYKAKVVTNISELEKIFKFKSGKKSISTRKRDNTLNQALKALKLDMSNKVVKRENGYSEIYTRNGDLVASISDPGLYGFRYARVEGDEVKRYAIRGGEIQFTYIDDPDETLANGSVAFLKNYLKAVKENKVVTHTSKHQ